MAETTSLQLAADLRVSWQVATDGLDAAERLLAIEVARLSRRPVDEVRIGRSCPHCGSSQHGRPVLLGGAGRRPDLSLSLSRAPGMVLVAVSCHHRVGVDIERLDAAGTLASTTVVLHPEEHARGAAELTRVWVRKESVLKATGEGLRVDPAQVRLSAPDEEPRVLEWPADHDPGSVWMADMRIDGYAACVSVLRDGTRLSSPTGAPGVVPL